MAVAHDLTVALFNVDVIVVKILLSLLYWCAESSVDWNCYRKSSSGRERTFVQYLLVKMLEAYYFRLCSAIISMEFEVASSTLARNCLVKNILFSILTRLRQLLLLWSTYRYKIERSL